MTDIVTVLHTTCVSDNKLITTAFSMSASVYVYIRQKAFYAEMY